MNMVIKNTSKQVIANTKAKKSWMIFLSIASGPRLSNGIIRIKATRNTPSNASSGQRRAKRSGCRRPLNQHPLVVGHGNR